MENIIEIKRGQINDGVAILNAETNEVLGIMRGSVGPCGESTGIFEGCKTTTPLNELGLRWVDEPTAPWE